MNKRGMTLLLALPFSAAGALALASPRTRASANSAPPFWSGSDTTGCILTDKCPIEVVKEKLTIEVGELAKENAMEERLSVYRGKVEAEYTFRNPTEEELEVTLAFPFGSIPDYAETNDFYADTSPYGILADGKEVNYTLRTSYAGSSRYNFDVDTGIARLYGDRTESFYKKELPVHATTYEVDLSQADADEKDWLQFGVLFDLDGKKTRAFSGNGNMVVSDGHAQCLFGFNCSSNSSDFTLYSVGEPVSVIGTKVFHYVNGEECAIEGAVVREGKPYESTFGEMLEERRPEDVSEEDWMNAFVDFLEENADSDCPYLSAGSWNWLTSRDLLMRWLEYSLTVPANGTLVNTVHAPIYPEVDFSRKENRVLSYTYLLSPAQKWASFGGIEIEIKTPLFLSDSSLKFDKVEGGYRLERNALPLGELTFSLSEKEISRVNLYSPYDEGDTALIVAIVLLSIFAAAGIAGVVVLVVRGKQRKKRRAEEEQRLRLGRAEEGTIDLPPVPPTPPTPTVPPEPPAPQDPPEEKKE